MLCFSYNVRLALSLPAQNLCPAPSAPNVACSLCLVSCVLCHNACNRRLYIIHAHALRPSFSPSRSLSVCARARLFVRLSLLPSVSLPVTAAGIATAAATAPVSFRMMTLFLADAVSSQRILTLLLLASFNL